MRYFQVIFLLASVSTPAFATPTNPWMDGLTSRAPAVANGWTRQSLATGTTGYWFAELGAGAPIASLSEDYVVSVAVGAATTHQWVGAESRNAFAVRSLDAELWLIRQLDRVTWGVALVGGSPPQLLGSTYRIAPSESAARLGLLVDGSFGLGERTTLTSRLSLGANTATVAEIGAQLGVQVAVTDHVAVVTAGQWVGGFETFGAPPSVGNVALTVRTRPIDGVELGAGVIVPVTERIAPMPVLELRAGAW